LASVCGSLYEILPAPSHDPVSSTNSDVECEVAAKVCCDFEADEQLLGEEGGMLMQATVQTWSCLQPAACGTDCGLEGRLFGMAMQVTEDVESTRAIMI